MQSHPLMLSLGATERALANFALETAQAMCLRNCLFQNIICDITQGGYPSVPPMRFTWRPSTIPAWKSLLFFGTGVLVLEGTQALLIPDLVLQTLHHYLLASPQGYALESLRLKEWQGNWRANRRDPAAYLDRKISYLALELKVTEMGLERYGKGNKKA
ncbi:hypothetical protein RHMOL_Rhmol11G0193800 [Rhododendron molle]|uniref:Uncharacterized protein n=2 Tax=Rhododendron molle TaxID=49168 RepID=A0ACC0LUK3_RHOML|nr:hypothetical protein RHMOL_Rhmol11G0193800 [Rhododendron molle]KAI8532187.1 hypothetical protein RHMOL_Rhmol11G0193800 [Rhododendron molle]